MIHVAARIPTQVLECAEITTIENEKITEKITMMPPLTASSNAAADQSALHFPAAGNRMALTVAPNGI